jgi:uncharacterized protein (DUF983 family)
VTAFGVWIELAYSPHLVTTLPFLLIMCILPLRFFKGWLVASQGGSRRSVRCARLACEQRPSPE